MTTATLKREDDVKNDQKTSERMFLGDYMPFAGVRYYVIFGERNLAKGKTKIGPVGWRGHTEMTETRPKITWAA